MLRKISMLVVVAVLVLGVSDAYAKCKRIQGTSSGEIVLTAGVPGSLCELGCFSGTVNGSLRGEVELVINAFLDTTADGVNIFTGDTVFVNNKGDVLLGIDTISSDIDLNPGDLIFHSADLIRWIPVGSTGVFEGATGHAVLDATLNFTNSTFETQWTGELCTP